MPNRKRHEERMDAFWDRLREIQAQIDRTRRVLDDAHLEARAVEEEIAHQRDLSRESAANHQWLTDWAGGGSREG